MDFRNRQDLPKGIRNNNPGNLRDYGINWLGLAEHVPDNGMCIFIDMKYGIRAFLECYHADVTKHGIATVQQYTTKYAPPSENNTSNYIGFICSHTGLNPDSPLPTDTDTVVKLFQAQIGMEDGTASSMVSMDDIQTGVALFNQSVPNWLS